MRTAYFLVITLFAFGCLQAQSPIALEATTDREFYREDARNNLYLQARIVLSHPPSTAPKNPTSVDLFTPPPRNLAFVLDRSGSMSGPSVEALRTALPTALAQLAPHDHIAIITFGSEIETLVAAQSVSQLRDLPALLATIEPAGGSALYDALNQAAAQLRRHASPTSINHLILLTDGPPTKGPRDAADFAKLAEALTRERITLSTLGLGEESPEDLLAQLARSGQGNFRYLAQPDQISPALLAELPPPLAEVLGLDAELTITFDRDISKLESHAWIPATLVDQALTYRLPRLVSEQDLTVFISSQFTAHRFSREVANLRLTWRDPVTNQSQTLTRAVTVDLASDTRTVTESARPEVMRTAARVLLSEGLQEAINQIDKSDPRRALRALRSARSEAVSLNYDLEDPDIAATIRQFEATLNQLAARPLTALDRKLLRSGLQGQLPLPFESPKN